MLTTRSTDVDHCPSPEQLQRLLDEQLSEPEQAALSEHVDGCAACLAKLERLTAATSGIRSPTPSGQGQRARDQEQRKAGEGQDFLDQLKQKPPSPEHADLNRASSGSTVESERSPTGRRAAEWPVVAGYEILAVLGQGGMGVVYKARQTGLHRLVALKMIASGSQATPRDIARFRLEAEAVARMQHPHIVQIYEIGEAEGRPYFALEFVEGGSLAAKIRGNPQPVEVAARLIETLARAIHVAHQQGIIHRDLKPSNVLLAVGREQQTADTTNAHGRPSRILRHWSQITVPKITDFGLAKRLEGSDAWTQTGEVVGTPSYMAPEQAAGKGQPIGPGVDVYALGSILYELLTGRPPFKAETALETVLQVLHEEPVPPGRLRPKLPRDLQTICLKCLAKEPRKRYASAEALADDLRRFMNGEPIQARPVSEVERLWRWGRRNPATASLLVALVAVFWIGFALVGWNYWKAETARQNEVRERQAAEEARQQEAKQREQAEKTLYYGKLLRARLEWLANNIADAERILDDCPADRRGWEWSFLKQRCHADLFTLRGHTGWVYRVAFSPDGQLIASAGGGNPFWGNPGAKIEPGEVILWDAVTGERRRTLRRHTHLIYSLAFSPDGQLLATAGEDKKVILWNVATGAVVRMLPEPNGPVRSVAFSPDGKSLATGFSDQTGAGGIIQLWDVTPGPREPSKPRLTLRGHRLADWRMDVAFRPDDRQLASVARGAWEGDVKLWDLTTGTEALTLDANQAPFNGAAFSPDGRYLAAGEWGILKLWDAAAGRLRQSIGGHNGLVWGVAFSPDGRQLASAGADGTVRVWDLPRGDEFVLLRGHQGTVRSVAFSPDGQRLVTGGIDGTVKVWDLTVHPEYGSVQRAVGEPEAIAFADNGARLVIAQRGGRVLTTDSDTSALVGPAPQVALTSKWMTPAEPACLDMDGRWLAGVSQEDPTVAKCWEARTGQERLVLRGHTLPVGLVTSSPGGRRIATSAPRWSPVGPGPRGEPPRAEVKVWDGAEGRPLLELAEPGLSVTRLALSSEGDRLALAGLQVTSVPGEEKTRREAVLRVYAIDGGQMIHSFSGGDDPFLGLAFSPDGTRLAAAGNLSEDPRTARTVLLWDLASERPTITHQGPEGAMDVTFSPDGRRLAVASRLMIKILDAASGEEVLILRGYAHAHPDTNGFNPRVRFSPDGKRIVAICHDMHWPVSVWSVEDETARDPAARLRAAERRAIGVHLELASNPYNRQNKDRAVFLFHLKCLEGVPVLEASEYVGRGKLYAWNGQWGKADADFAKAFELAPDSSELHFECGWSYAEHGKWDKAAAHYAKGLALDPRHSERYRMSLCLHWQIGDREGYRRLCREMLDRFGQIGDPLIAHDVAYGCLLTPDLADETKRVMRLADRSVSGTEGRSEYGWFLQTKGMAEYRAGRYEQAVDWLRKSQPRLPNLPAGKSVTSFFLALAYHRLGRADEARATLAQALQLVEQEFGTVDNTSVSGYWPTWFVCQIVRREAEALINGKAAEPKK
jgi:WD40 repeat protein/serine/threonine protein kinase/tetratricopeptide (TPR) repeat protein